MDLEKKQQHIDTVEHYFFAQDPDIAMDRAKPQKDSSLTVVGIILLVIGLLYGSWSRIPQVKKENLDKMARAEYGKIYRAQKEKFGVKYAGQNKPFKPSEEEKEKWRVKGRKKAEQKLEEKLDGDSIFNKFTIIMAVLGIGLILYNKKQYLAELAGYNKDYKEMQSRFETRPADEVIDKMFLDAASNIAAKLAPEQFGLDEDELIADSLIVPVPADRYALGRDDTYRYLDWDLYILMFTEHFLAIYACRYEFQDDLLSNIQTHEFFYKDITQVNLDDGNNEVKITLNNGNFYSFSFDESLVVNKGMREKLRNSVKALRTFIRQSKSA